MDATVIVTMQGIPPISVCDHHALALDTLYGLLDTEITTTPIDEPMQCEYCPKETK